MPVLTDTISYSDYVPSNPSEAAVLNNRYVCVIDVVNDAFMIYDVLLNVSDSFSGIGSSTSGRDVIAHSGYFWTTGIVGSYFSLIRISQFGDSDIIATGLNTSGGVWSTPQSICADGNIVAFGLGITYSGAFRNYTRFLDITNDSIITPSNLTTSDPSNMSIKRKTPLIGHNGYIYLAATTNVYSSLDGSEAAPSAVSAPDLHSEETGAALRSFKVSNELGYSTGMWSSEINLLKIGDWGQYRTVYIPTPIRLKSSINKYIEAPNNLVYVGAYNSSIIVFDKNTTTRQLVYTYPNGVLLGGTPVYVDGNMYSFNGENR